MKKIALILLIIQISTFTFGQKIDSTKNQFFVKSKVKKDSIILRWQPSNELLWKVASKVGYKIERYTVQQDTTKPWVKKEWNIKPWTETEWHTKKPNDTTGMIMATLAFGKELPIEEKAGLNALLLKKHENDNRFFLAMFLASYNLSQAQIMGLGLVDKDFNKGEKYLYKIMSNTSQFKMISDTALVFIDTDEVNTDPEMPPILKEEGDKLVHLKLNRKYADNFFVGYYFEKSEDGTTFKRLNAKPFIQIFDKSLDKNLEYIKYTDSLDQNYKKYHYRVIGITPFGELISSKTPLIASGIDLKPPAQINNLKVQINLLNQVSITWVKSIIEPDIAGFIVGRSNKIEGPFNPIHTKLIEPQVTNFIDMSPNSFEGNYYTVSAIDTAGNAAISLPVFISTNDESPPAVPTGLKGSIDSTGVIKITWDKNKELDLEGYLVYTANQKDHVFTPISKGFLLDEFFADSTTLKTLTKNKFYKVVAFDKARKASPYSEILTIKRPDKVAPVAPVFNNFAVSDSTSTISWIISSSDDVVKQVLYRKEVGKTEYQEIKSFNSNVKEFNDNNLKSGVPYSYIIQAIDESGLKSEKSFPIQVKPYKTGIKPKVKQFTASLNSDKKSINLAWMHANAENQRVLLYRKINDGELKLIEGINFPTTKYSDKVKEKGVYSYATKIKYADGSESVLTDFTKIDIQ